MKCRYWITLAFVFTAPLLSCDRSPVQPASSLPAITASATGYNNIVFEPETKPGTYLAKGSCANYWAKAMSGSVPPVWLINEMVTWTTPTSPAELVSFDNANTPYTSTVTRRSGDLVTVCGVGDGFGEFSVYPKTFDVDVGKPASVDIPNFPVRMYPNSAPIKLIVNVTDSRGQVRDLVSRTAWASTSPTVADVSNTGWLTAHAIGSTMIMGCVFFNACVTKTLPVTASPYLAGIRLRPTTASVRIGATVQLYATTLDQYGNAFAAPVTWNTSNADLATVSNGLVSPKALGQVTISATSGAFTATATVTVLPPLLVASEVSGPTWINQLGYYTWTTGASGGTAPYSYRWEINFDRYPGWGPINGSSNTVNFGVSPDDGNFQLRYTVTSSDGQTAMGGIYVTVTGGTGCETEIIC